MNKIKAKKKYLEYLESLNESKSKEKKIKKATDKIRKFMNNDNIIDFIINKVVSKDSTNGIKYLVWFADIIKPELIKKVKNDVGEEFEDYINVFIKYLEIGVITEDMINILKNGNKVPEMFLIDEEIKNDFNFYIKRWFDINDRLMTEIVDWLKSPLRENEETNLSEYKTFEEAYIEAENWHNSLKSTGVIEDEHGEIIMTFDDGFYWIDLETTEDEAEGEAMGHCGTTTEGTTILSLRDKNKSPHVTMSINEDDESITQCKGKNNKKPIEKYHKYIFEFMLNNKEYSLTHFNLEYDNDDDFDIDDLSEELYKKLILSNSNWLDKDFDVYKLLEIFKSNITEIKNLNNFYLLKILYEIQNDNKYNEIYNQIINLLNDDIFNINGNMSVIKNGRWYLKNDTFSTFLNIPFIEYDNISVLFSQLKMLNEILYNVTNLKLFEFDINNSHLRKCLIEYNIENVVNYNDEIYKYVSKGKFGNKVINIAKKYDKDIHIPKLKEIFNNYIKYLEQFDIKIINFLDKKLNYSIGISSMLNYIQYDELIDDTIDFYYKWILDLKDDIQKNNKKFMFKYDYIKEFNEYLLENLRNETINESYSVADDILDWYELLFKILKTQIKGFVDAIKEDDKKFKMEVEQNNETYFVDSVETSVPKDVMNKLIEENISKNNGLILKDIDVVFALTIMPEEKFTNYLFSSDAHFNDKDSKLENGVMKNTEFFFEVYLPDVIFEDDIDKVLNDYDIIYKVRQSLSHELDHAYEFYNRKKTTNYFSEKALNDIIQLLRKDKFVQISDELVDFLRLCYLSLSFEISARITEIFYVLKEFDIKNVSDFWYYVKSSGAWDEITELKDFNHDEFYENIKFNMDDFDLEEVLIESGYVDEDNIENINIKDEILKIFVEKFNEYVKTANKEYNVNLKTVKIKNDPRTFFKYFENNFKKSWEHFYKRISKMSSKYNY